MELTSLTPPYHKYFFNEGFLYGDIYLIRAISGDVKADVG